MKTGFGDIDGRVFASQAFDKALQDLLDVMDLTDGEYYLTVPDGSYPNEKREAYIVARAAFITAVKSLSL